MPFSKTIREKALVKSHRRCCICHNFAGRNVNVHHIIHEADGGPNTLDNAIALCFNCHAEAGHYNPNHPLGTKYSPQELVGHRDQWWEHCKKYPSELVGCGLDVTYKTDRSSNGDVHTYWLLASFRNGSPTKQDGYVLEILFPIAIPLEYKAHDYNTSKPVIIGEHRFSQVTLRSDETIYRDQTIQIVDPSRRPLSYQMNHELFFTSGRTHWELRWNFYAGNMPPILEVKPWDEMHSF